MAAHKALAQVPFSTEQLPKYNGRNWPGFYTSTGDWVVPDRYLVTDDTVSWENSQQVLLTLLNDRGIDLNSTIHITL